MAQKEVTETVATEETPVTVKTTHTIQCANPQSLEALPSPFILGPLDSLVFFAIPVNIVWVYESSTAHELVPITRLQRAISLLLDHYPHLTGRLHINSDNGIRSITRLGSGMSLFEATCDVPLSSFRNASTGQLHMPDLPAAGNALLPPWELSLEGVQREPVFTVKHTRFACGSVSIGMRIPHTLCAAEGFFHLYQDLAELYRGLSTIPGGGTPTLKQPPHIQSLLAEAMLSMTPEERSAALSFQPPGYSIAPVDAPISTPGSSVTNAPPPMPVSGRELRFSADELAALKAHAQPPEGSGSRSVSTFSALCAHLWQRQHVARLTFAKEQKRPTTEITTSFLTSVNYSVRLAKCPPKYFPNALMTPFVELDCPVEDFAAWPLWRVAQAVHSVTHSISPSVALDTARWIAAQPDKYAIHQGFPARYGAVMASAWNRFPMYSGAELVDEGGAPVSPVLASQPFTPITLMDGLMYFLPTREANGDVEVALALSQPLWDVLERDEEFRRFGPRESE
ncbi:transferase [Phyllosticta capitalensis]